MKRIALRFCCENQFLLKLRYSFGSQSYSGLNLKYHEFAEIFLRSVVRHRWKKIFFLHLFFSSCIAMAEMDFDSLPQLPVCADFQENFFGPESVATGMPFHYNFRLRPEVEALFSLVDFAGSYCQERDVESSNSCLKIHASYAQEVAGRPLFRLMFGVDEAQAGGTYRLRGFAILKEESSGQRCRLELISTLIEVVKLL